MDTHGRRCLLAGFVAATLLLPDGARAGGFEVGDQGAWAAGRGGAFLVKASDLSALDYNPAGLARLRGTRFYYSHRLVHQDVWYRRARTLDWSDAVHGVPRRLAFEPIRDAKPWFPLGMMVAISSDFGLQDWAFAAGVYGPPAIGDAEYPDDGPQRYMMTDLEVMILYYTLSAAWKYQDLFGLGVSLQWVDTPRMAFEMVVDGNVAPGLVEPVESEYDMRTRIVGSDRVGATAILGAWARPHPEVEIGVAARLVPIWVDLDAKLSVDAVNLHLNEPPSLSRDGEPYDRVRFSLQMPAKVRAGVRWVKRDGEREVADVELDLHYDVWSIMKRFTLDAGLVVDAGGARVPLDTLHIQRNWRDTLAVKLGADWNVVPDILTLRAGFSYESPSVRRGYEYLDAFSFHRFSPSAGLTVSFWKVDLSLAYSYIYQPPVVVTEGQSRVYQQMPGSPCKAPYTDTDVCNERYLGQPAAAANAGTWIVDYHMIQAGLELGF
ncbi:MAG: outer membrane protein transport protein [Deltaproteobacteria bacterium]|nr:outer membrane protein transport protein [Deltaproteobacteria bacterium]